MKTLSYYGTCNLGDAIQTLAMERFLEEEHRIIKSGWAPRQQMESGMCINGWHYNPSERFPSRALFAGISADVQHLEGIAKDCKVACRDNETYDIALKLGLQPFLSGCVTSTLPWYDGPRQGVVCVDYGDVNDITNRILPNMSWVNQLTVALDRIATLQTAELVATTRLHVVLPCIAMGTPVYFRIPKWQSFRWDRLISDPRPGIEYKFPRDRSFRDKLAKKYSEGFSYISS